MESVSKHAMRWFLVRPVASLPGRSLIYGKWERFVIYQKKILHCSNYCSTNLWNNQSVQPHCTEEGQKIVEVEMLQTERTKESGGLHAKHQQAFAPL